MFQTHANRPEALGILAADRHGVSEVNDTEHRPPVESGRRVPHWLHQTSVLLGIHSNGCFLCGNNRHVPSLLSRLLSGVDAEVKDLTNEVILIVTTALGASSVVSTINIRKP